VSHLVPAEAHEAAVVLGAVPPHHDVGLKVGLPLDPVGRGGRSPFGKVSRSVAFSPHVIPREREEEVGPTAEGTVKNVLPCPNLSEGKCHVLLLKSLVALGFEPSVCIMFLKV